MGEFNNALSSFLREFANGGAIRHFVELEYSVKEIKSKLDFPASVEDIAEYVWKTYVDMRVVCLDESDMGESFIEKTEYVTDYGKYGKTSLRKVTTKVETASKSYIECDIGKQNYKDRVAFTRRLERMSDSSRSMIEDLPWPLTKVYVDRDTKLGEAVSEYNALSDQNRMEI